MNHPAPGILWTSMPVEMVMEGMDSGVSPLVEVMAEGRVLQVRPVGDGKGVLERLVSGDPQDYLDPRWQPGTSVSLNRSSP